jgi:hypothetical protein
LKLANASPPFSDSLAKLVHGGYNKNENFVNDVQEVWFVRRVLVGVVVVALLLTGAVAIGFARDGIIEVFSLPLEVSVGDTVLFEHMSVTVQGVEYATSWEGRRAPRGKQFAIVSLHIVTDRLPSELNPAAMVRTGSTLSRNTITSTVVLKESKMASHQERIEQIAYYVPLGDTLTTTTLRSPYAEDRWLTASVNLHTAEPMLRNKSTR